MNNTEYNERLAACQLQAADNITRAFRDGYEMGLQYAAQVFDKNIGGDNGGN